MSVTLNFGWPLPKDREQLLELFLRERLLDIDADLTALLAPGGREVCSVYHAANQSVANAAWTTLAFNSESVDTAGMHDNSTNNSRITIQKAGVYVGLGLIAFAGSGAGSVRAGRVIANGVASAAVGNGQDAPLPGSLITVIFAPLLPVSYAVNDYVQMQAYQDSGGSLNVLYDDANGYHCKLSLWAL